MITDLLFGNWWEINLNNPVEFGLVNILNEKGDKQLHNITLILRRVIYGDYINGTKPAEISINNFIKSKE